MGNPNTGNEESGLKLPASWANFLPSSSYTAADVAVKAVAGLGYTPLNAATYTAADVAAKAVAGLGYTPLNAATYTAADVAEKAVAGLTPALGAPFESFTVLIRDMVRASVEAPSGGLNTVLYDNAGNPSVMYVLPKFKIEDIHASLGSGIHPAFIVNGVEKSEIFIGTMQASVGSNGRAISSPGKAPWVSINFDNARNACALKGPGWHMMTNWEWAAVMLWCLKNGYQPRGNTRSGSAHDALWETISGGSASQAGLCGLGPATWRHDRMPTGISDLVGNVWEWQDGLKLIDGQIVMPNDNDFNLPEAQWPGQGVFFDSTGSAGSSGVVNGEPILSAERLVSSHSVATADSDYTHIAGEAGWRSMAKSTSYDLLPMETQKRIAQAGISPKVGQNLIFPTKGAIWCRNYGERIPIRGGYWGSASNAGIGALPLDNRRSNVYGYVGFRPAFIGN